MVFFDECRTAVMGVKDLGEKLVREIIQKQGYFGFVSTSPLWSVVGNLVVIDQNHNQQSYIYHVYML